MTAPPRTGREGGRPPGTEPLREASRTGLPGAAVEGRPRARGIFGGSAWYLGQVAGIDLAVDHSWVLIFLLVTFSLAGHFGAEHAEWSAAQRWAVGIVSSLLFFASIVLHELGHSLVAMRLGVRVRSITLFVFGGVAQLASEPRRPRDEVLVAVAGPLVSVTLGVAFLSLGRLAGGAFGAVEASFSWLGRINLLLAAFNAVPGFPLDGGRVLRGALWYLIGSFERATRYAALSGSLFALTLMGIGGLVALLAGEVVSGLWLVLIGWFLLAAARTTVGHVVVERLLERVRVGDAMGSVREACLSGAETVAEVASERVLRRGLRAFYVADPALRLLGIVTLRELAATPSAERDRKLVRDVMIPVARLAVLRPDETGWAALQRMAERNVNQLPVLEDGVLLGAITREQLLTLVQAALDLGAEAASGSRGPLPGGGDAPAPIRP